MADLSWLSDEQWAVVGQFMPLNQPGARQVDDRRVVSGMLRTGGRRRDVPMAYGPATTVYDQFNRWPRRGFLRAMLRPWPKPAGSPARRPWTVPPSRRTAALTGAKEAKDQAIGPSRDGATSKVHILSDTLGRPAVIHLTPGNSSDVRTAPAMLAAAPGRIRRILADKGYDADWLRADLRKAGIVPVIPGTRSRKRPIRYDKKRPKDRWRAEAVFCRLKDFRRLATRYNKLARDYASAVAPAVIVAFWW